MATEEEWTIDDDEETAELYRLMGEKFFGDISDEDDKSLGILLQEPWALQEWEKFLKTFENQKMVDTVTAMLEKNKTGGLAKAFQRKAAQRLLFKSSLLAMALLVISIAAYYLWPAAPATGVRLQLANGKTIALAGVSNMNVDDAIIFNDTAHRLLSFFAATTSKDAYHTLIVPAGADYHTRLSDGTEIFLNAASQLSFPFSFSGSKREITINGEARLKVAKDAKRSFIVHLPNTDVEVLGTSFNVNTYDSSAIAISLQEGLIQVRSGQQRRLLQAGFKAIVESNGSINVHAFEPAELSWQRGSYDMTNTPLGDMEVVLPRWLGIKVVFDNPATKKENYSGSFLKKEPIDSLVKRLEHSDVPAYYDYKDSVLHIR